MRSVEVRQLVDLRSWTDRATVTLQDRIEVRHEFRLLWGIARLRVARPVGALFSRPLHWPTLQVRLQDLILSGCISDTAILIVARHDHFYLILPWAARLSRPHWTEHRALLDGVPPTLAQVYPGSFACPISPLLRLIKWLLSHGYLFTAASTILAAKKVS